MIKSKTKNLYKIEIPTLINLDIFVFSNKLTWIFLKLKKKIFKKHYIILVYFSLTNLSFFQMPSSTFPLACVKIPSPCRKPFSHSPTYLSPLAYM